MHLATTLEAYNADLQIIFSEYSYRMYACIIMCIDEIHFQFYENI